MLFQIFVLFTTQLALPIFLLFTLWKRNEPSKFAWLLKLLYTGAFLLYIYVAGRWDWLSYYLRYIFPLLFVIVAIGSYRRVAAQPFFAQSGKARWWNHSSALLTLLIFAGFLAWTLLGYVYADEPVRLAFPLQNGWYYVGQGGNSTRLNYHNSNQAQQYALDIVALNALGIRAWGIYPNTLERYVVYGATIHSPCDGTVAAAVDGLPDQIPPQADREHLAGNHVVLSCQGVNVLLAHMQNGSVRVEAGDPVLTGETLGRVGNSGNTSEPHLHIHAVRGDSVDVLEGEGVPILLDGRFAVRNTTFGGCC